MQEARPIATSVRFQFAPEGDDGRDPQRADPYRPRLGPEPREVPAGDVGVVPLYGTRKVQQLCHDRPVQTVRVKVVDETGADEGKDEPERKAPRSRPGQALEYHR